MNTAILSSKFASPAVDVSFLSEKLNARVIFAEELSESSLEGVTLLVNALGNSYCETTFSHLLAYFENGGDIILPTPKPFTEPFYIKEEKVIFGDTSDAGLRRFRLAETVACDGECSKNVTFTAQNSRYTELAELLSATEIKCLYSPAYHLSYNIGPAFHPYFAPNIKDAELHLLVTCDEGDVRRAAPLTRVSLFSGGEAYFVNLQAQDHIAFCNTLIPMLAADSLLPVCNLEFSTLRSLYHEGETVQLRIAADIKRGSKATFTVSVADHVFAFVGKGKFEKTIDVEGLKKADLNAHITATSEGRLVEEKDFGFYVTTPQELKERAAKYSPLTFDPKVAPDYMLKDGVPFPMHGVNFFCTDGMRTFLINPNITQLKKDFVRLRTLGFNILRTGIWVLADEFYEADGRVKDMTARNLQAIFLAASEADFTVQFVLDAFSFNLWDRYSTPLFEGMNNSCTKNAVASFSQALKDFKNVQLDIINEPSYNLNDAWSLATPLEYEPEIEQYRDFLRKRYNGDIDALRAAWGVSPDEVAGFDTVMPPPASHFSRDDKLDRKNNPTFRVSTRDFYDFADTAFAAWMKSLKDASAATGADIPMTLGRDEPTRVPTHQRGMTDVGYDFTSWHQWHHDSIILSEYLLCKIRGTVCCGQEIGVYPFFDYRYDRERLSEDDVNRMLCRKMLYTFGNFLLWQAQSDPFMNSICEFQLGVLRADGSESPSCDFLRRLGKFEDTVAPLLTHRREPDDILLVFPESLHFSPDSPLAQKHFMRAAFTLHNQLRRQCNVTFESTLSEENRRFFGSPKLIILTDCVLLRESAWQFLLGELEKGATLLVCSDVDCDEYGRDRRRLADITDAPYLRRNALSFESFTLEGKTYTVDISSSFNDYSPSKRFTALDFSNGGVTVLEHGKGKLIYCCAPVCCDPSEGARAALYSFAAKTAELSEPLFDTENDKSVFIYPMEYDGGVLYTVINDGGAKTVTFTDRISSSEHSLSLDAEGCAKLFVMRDGSEKAVFIN